MRMKDSSLKVFDLSFPTALCLLLLKLVELLVEPFFTIVVGCLYRRVDRNVDVVYYDVHTVIIRRRV